MTPIHALTVAAAIVGVLCLAAFIVWEVYRHWDEIERLCREAEVDPPTRWIDRNAMGTVFDDE